jgi:hypothetical protein
MKKLFFLMSVTTIIFFGCSKHNDTNNTLVKPKTLVANAGLDSTIDTPLPYTGLFFEAVLNGRASHDSASQILIYSCTEIDDFVSAVIKSPNTDTTEVIFGDVPYVKKTIYKFRLTVVDGLGHTDYDSVEITINRKFDDEFDGLSWNSTNGTLTSFSLLNNLGDWSFLFQLSDPPTPDFLNICTFNGNCTDISNWKMIPYVPYDSIKLTDKDLFYSTNSDNADDIANGYDWCIIYATQKAGIDFNQKFSLGILREVQ